MSNRWLEINYSLRICRKVFAILKQKNPDLIPDYVDIIPYRKNSKNCHFNDACRELGIEDNNGWIAHFDDRQGHVPHICIKQDFLFFPFDIPTRKKEDQGKAPPSWDFCNGNWILIEVTVHELCHYIQLGHDEDFFKIYHKFLSQMTQVVISGEFYYWYSRRHQSKKRSGKANKQTAETREWVDNYLAWK